MTSFQILCFCDFSVNPLAKCCIVTSLNFVWFFREAIVSSPFLVFSERQMQSFLEAFSSEFHLPEGADCFKNDL